MKKKTTVFAFGILVLYWSLTAYLGWNVFSWFRTFWGQLNPWLFAAGWFMWAMSFLIGRLGHQWKLFSLAGSYWLAFFEYGILLLPIADIIVLFAGTESVFAVGLVFLLLFAFIFLAGSYFAYSPVVKELDIAVKGAAREPLLLVIASDFHLGVLSGKNHLCRFVRKVNEIQPDVVLLAGDLVDDDPVWFVRYGMDEVMKKIEAPLGVYGVLGNHDYYGRKIPLLIKEMKRAGVNVLQDETICIDESFYVTGREDRINRKRKLLKELKPESELPWFVMDHTPADLKTPIELGVDLHLSGHTHKGQMWPNRYFTKKLFELDYGYAKKGDTHFLVSSGFGFWGPAIRLGSRSELWKITMNFKPE